MFDGWLSGQDYLTARLAFSATLSLVRSPSPPHSPSDRVDPRCTPMFDGGSAAGGIGTHVSARPSRSALDTDVAGAPAPGCDSTHSPALLRPPLPPPLVRRPMSSRDALVAACSVSDSPPSTASSADSCRPTLRDTPTAASLSAHLPCSPTALALLPLLLPSPRPRGAFHLATAVHPRPATRRACDPRTSFWRAHSQHFLPRVGD